MLESKVIIVTGGATGIGLGISAALATKGARVAIVQPELSIAQSAADAIENACGFAADIRNRAQVGEMVDEVVRRLGRIDGLVNNAAITGPAAVGAFTEAPEEQVDRIIDTNLKGTIWCSQAVARHLIQRRTGGCILHITSVGAFAAQELASFYCATKAAQVMLTKGMALELAPHSIRVNAIAPGDIDTDTSRATRAQAQGASGKHVRQTPLGRRGLPSDVAGAAAFLFSDEAAFITGATLTVDGGFLTY